MREADLQIVDESMREVQTMNCSLLIRIDDTAIYYTIIDLTRNKFIALEKLSFDSQVTNALEELQKLVVRPEFKKPFKTVYCCFSGTDLTLVPEGLFDKDSKEDLFKLNYQLKEGYEISSELIKGIRAYAVFSTPKDIVSALRKHFFNIRIGHSSVSLIEGLLSQNKRSTQPVVFVQVQITHFEIIVIADSSLKFYNSFKPKTAEDYIYYLLFTMEQLNLNPESAEVVVYGELVKNSAIYNLMYKYIRNVKFGAKLEHYEYSYKIDEVPSHYYFSLFSQQLCV